MVSRELFWKLYYRIPESEEFVLVESEILGFGIRNPESLKIRVRNSVTLIRIPESSTWNLESTSEEF